MVANFYEDLAKAKKGEDIVLQVLRNSTEDYDFEDISNKKECWHKGDIKALENSWSLDEYYIDVKDDGCINYTGNILAEHRVWYAGSGWQDGFMQNSSYDFVAYLSQPDNKIYMLDFEAWKKHYKTTYKSHKYIDHYNYGRKSQTTDGYLMSLNQARALNIVVAEIEYDFDSKRGYIPVKIES